jgi:hypothetical protein
MSVIEIVSAEREGARLVFGFCGPSGCGKTFTALQFAYGLANYDAEKVGLLDTENRRGRLYSDILKRSTRPTEKKFLRGDLYAPFSPSRYVDAIQQFQAAGVEVLVIDSATHEWEGIGGCQEIAEGNNPRMPNWNRAKKEHKLFMNAALQCDMHIVFCVRAREKSVPEKDSNGKTVFRDMGMQPIQEKNFMFEMTASLMLYNQGDDQEVLKCPDVLQPYLGRRKGYITADDGKAVRAWVDGAKVADPAVEKFRNRLLSNTEPGRKHIESCWDKTPAEIRTELGDTFKTQIFASAKAFDDARAQAAGFGPQSGDDTKAAIFATAAPEPTKEVQQKAAEPVQEKVPEKAEPSPEAAEVRKPAPDKAAVADPVF